MLFFPFLKISWPKERVIYQRVFALFAAMIGIGLLFYCLLLCWNKEIATIAFLLAFTPTATAAPVVMTLLKRNVEYVVTAVIVTNLLTALSLPFVLNQINSGITDVAPAQMLFSTLVVVLVPLGVAQFVKSFFAKIADALISLKQLPLYIWLLILYLATSKASAYLLNSAVSLSLVVGVATIAFLLCVVNFYIGYHLGGTRYAVEASQSLGQKNTMFTTWVALEFVSPVAALGPVFYLIFQNIYNSVLLSRANR